jgi:hypothetical protein
MQGHQYPVQPTIYHVSIHFLLQIARGPPIGLSWKFSTYMCQDRSNSRTSRGGNPPHHAVGSGVRSAPEHVFLRWDQLTRQVCTRELSVQLGLRSHPTHCM